MFKTYRWYPSFLRYVVNKGTLITLHQAEGHEDKEFPRRELLDCHYRLAEIYNVSGTTKYIEFLIRRWDDMRHGAAGAVMPESGSFNLSEYMRAAFWDVAHFA